ncbi:MAG: hypothetical protein GFH25_541276n7 [Chloroflexi bacterium AL-N10]|nr:hypothetical protein [Chloroflexi bacterium AL-N1]NOK71088.1 hypothetical protein [Chloroflexi bacterium AL-N10]NOK77335.1 hypothetical protein [Chloroflexi bacterium AL-N5]
MEKETRFGLQIKQLRKSLDLTQVALGERVGCSPETIRKIEAGRIRPSRQIAERLANQLAIPMDERSSFIQRARSPISTSATKNGSTLASTNGQTNTPTRAPYVGLDTFQEEDADVFFGRTQLVEQLINKVAQSNFLVVLGPSGSGKSSLVLAGVLPRLRQGAVTGSETWHYVTIKPGARPLDTLAVALTQIHEHNLPEALELSHQLAENERALLLAADLLDTSSRLVLVIDQFEELWTQAPADPHTSQNLVQQHLPFIQQLLTAAAAPDHPVFIIITMRADFLHRAAEYSELAQWIGEHDVIVSPMQPEELRQAIEHPAQIVGGRFEAGLTDELIKQVVEQPGALPLLGYTLLELWNARQPNGTMTWATYHVLGGVEGALAMRADDIIHSTYNAEEQAMVQQILIRLVQPGENVIDTRQRVSIEDLVPATHSTDEIIKLLTPLIDARLLTAGYDMLHDTDTIEVSHEALIRAWPALNDWITQSRDDLRLHLQLEQAAKEWLANDKNQDLLWMGVRLERAEAWVARTAPQLTERDMHFLQISRQHVDEHTAREIAAQRERERLLAERAVGQRYTTRLRWLLTIVGIAGVLALVFGILALMSRQEAQQQRSQAEVAAQSSQAAAYAGEALFELERQPEQALLLAFAAYTNESPNPSPFVTRAFHQTFENTLLRASLEGHTAPIRATAWSPNGRWVLTGSDDTTVRVWDPTSGEQVGTFEGHTQPIRAIAWGPNSESVITGSADQTARIWHVSTKQTIHILQGHDGWVSAAAWHPDGQFVVTGSYDATARIWDATSGTTIRTLRGHTEAIRSVAWSPDGRSITTSGDDGSIRVWDAQDGTIQQTITDHPGGVWSVAWSPDGQQLVSGSTDGAVRVWDITTGDLIQTLTGHVGWIWSVAWSPDGQHIVSGSFDGTARIWNVSNGSTAHTLYGHTGTVWSVGWSPDGQQVITGSDDSRARIWETSNKVSTHHLQGDTAPRNLATWSPDTQYVARWDQDDIMQIWDTTIGKVTQQIDYGDGPVRWVNWSANSQTILIATDDGAIQVWNALTGKLIQSLDSSQQQVHWMYTSPGENLLVVGYDDGTSYVHNLTDGTLLREFPRIAQEVKSLAWQTDESAIAVGLMDGTLQIWEVATGKILQTWQGHQGVVRSISWSPDSTLLLTGSDDRTAAIWDVSTGTELQRVAGHTGNIASVAWHPTGHQIVTGSSDGTAHIWSTYSGTLVRTLDNHTGGVLEVGWRHNGYNLVTGSDDGTTHVWLADQEEILALITERLCTLFSEESLNNVITNWRGCAIETQATGSQLIDSERP